MIRTMKNTPNTQSTTEDQTARRWYHRLAKYMRRFAHDVLGWHDGKGAAVGFDGCSMTSRCSQCGGRVLADSNGDWFLSPRQDEDSFRANPVDDLTEKVIRASDQFMGEEASSTAHRRVFQPEEAFDVFDRPVNVPLAREQIHATDDKDTTAPPNPTIEGVQQDSVSDRRKTPQPDMAQLADLTRRFCESAEKLRKVRESGGVSCPRGRKLEYTEEDFRALREWPGPAPVLRDSDETGIPDFEGLPMLAPEVDEPDDKTRTQT